MLDRRVPVECHRLIATAIAIAPHFLECSAVESHERTAKLVCLGDEHLIADNDRGRSVHTLQLSRTPWEFGDRLAFGRIDGQQPPAGKHEDDVPPVNRCEYRT